MPSTSRSLTLLLLALCISHCCADSPSAEEAPFWPITTPWTPTIPSPTCTPADADFPRGPVTWSPHFAAYVYTLADFDTCSDESCVDAFTASTKAAPDCSFDGTSGTANEVETFRLSRCLDARQSTVNRYIPVQKPSAPLCSSAQQAEWNREFGQSPDYQACVKALTPTRGAKTCTTACRRLLRDSIRVAEFCLVSPRAGNLTQLEWLKHRLVWCLTVRGEPLNDPLFTVVDMPSPPPPTTAKPTKSPPSSASASDSKPSSKSGSASSSSSESSELGSGLASNSASRDDGSDASGPPIDVAPSVDTPSYPAMSPPEPGRNNFSNGAAKRMSNLLVAIALLIL